MRHHANPKPRRPVPKNVRTCFEPPTLEEAVFAAQGLTNQVEQQIEIAAKLMGLPEAEIEPHVMKTARHAVIGAQRPMPAPNRALSGRQSVVVERKVRRVAMPPIGG
jgi:hypothetical protein